MKQLSIFLSTLLLLCASESFAQSLYIWKPQGASTSAKVPGNWKISTCNGTTATVLPGSSDTLLFSNCSTTDAVLDTNLNVAFFSMKSNYTGTITRSGSFSLTAGKMKVSGGTFTGGSTAITINGTMTIDGGTFTATSGLMIVRSNFSKTGGTFNPNNGTIKFQNETTGQVSLSSSSKTSPVDFYSIIFDASDTAGTFRVNNMLLTVNNSMEISGHEQLFLNGDTILMTGTSTLTLSNTSNTGGGTAKIKFTGSGTQSITGNSGTDYTRIPNLIINKSGTLNLSGNIAIGGSGYLDYRAGTIAEGNSSFLFYYNDTIKGAMTFYDVEFAGHSSNFELIDTINVKNNLTLSGTAYSQVNNGGIKLSNDLIYNNSHSSSVLNTTIQFINIGGHQAVQGTNSVKVKKLKINAHGQTVELQKPTTVTNELNLRTGLLSTDATNLLTLNAGCTVVGGSDTSYVSGPMKKIGNTSFTFPIGGGLSYKPLGITAPSTSTDAFTAQYFDTTQTQGSSKDTLTYVSSCEYWNLTRSTGSSTVKVTLSWNQTTCDIYTLSTLRIARWDGSKWNNTGPATTTGTTVMGSVQTNGNLGSFGYVTIGKRSPLLYAYAGSDQNACGTSPLTIGVTPTASGGLTPYTYSWSPSLGLDDTTLSTPEARPGITTTYTLTVTDLDHTQATDQAVVTIYPGLLAEAGINGPVFTGGSRLLGGNPTVAGGTSPFTYSWLPTTALDDASDSNPEASLTSSVT